MSDISVNAFLSHHGVKGQHWGIRNKTEQKTSGTSKTNIKKHFGLTNKQIVIGSSILLGAVATSVILHKTGLTPTKIMKQGYEESVEGKTTKSLVETLVSKHGESTDEILPKGQIFTRLSKVSETEVRPGNYATYLPHDVARYMSTWGSDSNRHKIVIKALDDVKVPGLKTRFKTMGELLDKPMDSSVEKGQTLRQYIINREPTWRSKVWARFAPSSELGKNVYAREIGGNWNTGIGKAFTQRLVSKGFGAMLDDNDSMNLAKKPMVLLKSDLFKVVSNKQMSKSETDTAWKEFNRLHDMELAEAAMKRAAKRAAKLAINK